MIKNSQAEKLIERLEKQGVTLWQEEGKLRFKANAGVLKVDDKELLRLHKAEILQLLEESKKDKTFKHDLQSRHEPFPLTDVQQAYLMGRNGLFEYGDVACHIYLPLSYDTLDLKKAEQVWNKLIEKHEMLRAVIYEDGYQQILDRVPPFKIQDFGTESDETIMKRIGHSKYTVGQWPFFSVGVSHNGEHAVMHVSIEFIIADWTSIWILLSQFEALYNGKIETLPEIKFSFRDYVIAERKMRTERKYEIDKGYWMKRIPDFPESPKLPIQHDQESKLAEFERKSFQLSSSKWNLIKQNALKRGITPTALVLMAYAAVLERYSQNKRFALNLTILNRPSFHEDINQIVGDFTSTSLLEVDFSKDKPFIEIAKQTSATLFEDMDHRLYSGVEVMRELSRRKGAEAAFIPFVFTSAIGLLSSIASNTLQGITGKGISQTPQVFIDCQVMDGDFGMQANWDIRQGVFDKNMIQDMFHSFQNIVNRFVDPETLNLNDVFILPESQYQQLRHVNDTKEELPQHLLHEEIIKMAEKNPDKIAVIAGETQMTYRELLNLSLCIYEKLIALGCKKGDTVAILMPKTHYQVAAVLAILAANAIYVPITPNQGEKRIETILKKTDVKLIVSTSEIEMKGDGQIDVIFADQIPLTKVTGKLPSEGSADQLAYIMFTSGSTGIPKGVAITHQAVVNTIEAINRKFELSEKDSVLGISELNFDLSVYDIFGILSVGGTLVYPKEEGKREPAYLSGLIHTYRISVWNSVPALLQMLLSYAETASSAKLSSIRLSMLSGDWIPLELPERFLKKSPEARVISLGGATEASIWSIYHEYTGQTEGFLSIPYGTPLANQGFCILDQKLNDCPIGVPGELYITGKGLAVGYYQDEEQTAKQFIMHPKDRVRMYKTGDIGKYHTSGKIEFLGRADNQIKLNGHRIELGEIEAAVAGHPDVSSCAVIYRNDENDKKLVCYYETETVIEEEQDKKCAEFLTLCNGLSENAEKLMSQLDEGALKSAMRVRDEVIMHCMLSAIKNCVSSNIFSISKILNSGAVNEKYHWLIKYWIKILTKNGYLEKAEEGQYQISRDVENRISEIDLEQQWKYLKQIWLPEMGADAFFTYLKQNALQLNSLLNGSLDPIHLLYPDGKNDVVKAMYTENRMSQYLNRCICDFVKRYMESHDTVRILEVGAGTCATAIQATQALDGKRYTYHITDISSFFLPSAQKQFEGNDNVKFSLLNIDEDILQQGFLQNTYDVVIAVGVLENAKDIKRSLENIKSLVAPEGYFLFTEPVKEEVWILSSQGFLMTKPEDELRRNRAFINRTEWLSLLNHLDQKGEQIVYPSDENFLTEIGLDLYIKQLKLNKKKLSSQQLKSYIKKYLPSYMLPAHFHMLNQLPITANGKIDRKSLAVFSSCLQNDQLTEKLESRQLSPLQRQLANIWEQVGIHNLGPYDNFYEHGADSLIMAQVTGKIRETFGKEIPFDTLLRHLLNHPTLQQLSDFFEKETCCTAGITKQMEKIGYPRLYQAGEGPLRVVFHAAFGTMNSQKHLVSHLIKQNMGPVLTIALGDPERFYQMDHAGAVEQLAEDYLKLILETGYRQVQLIGYCFGGWLAITIGRRLQELGIELVDLSMIDCQTVPWVIEDEFLIEIMFLPNFNITYKQIGISDDKRLETAFLEKIDECGYIPNHALFNSDDLSDINTDEKTLQALRGMERRERFELYAKLSKENADEFIDVDMLESLFKAYVQTIRSVHCEMQPYIGDVRYFNAKEGANIFFGKEKNLSYWAELCIGDFSVFEIEGNHYTCVELEENAIKLAAMIGDYHYEN